MKTALSSLILGLGLVTAAKSAVWPDSVAPCNGTLQACINATAAGGAVQIRTSATINEEIVINKNFYLIADPGYRPVMASSRSISSNAPGGSYFFTLIGVDIGNGRVRVNASAATTASINLERVNVADGLFANAIEITGGSGALTANVRNCRMKLRDNPAEPDASGIIIAVLGSSATLKLLHNVIEIDSTTQGAGIKLLNSPSGGTQFSALGNRISGRGFMAGIAAIQNGATAGISANLLNNVISGQGGGSLAPGGLHVRLNAGTGRALLINNTIVRGEKGIVLSGSGDFQLSTVTNNIIAWHGEGLMIPAAQQADVVVDSNLFYANAVNDYTAGSGNLSGDPRLRSYYDLRLAADSPALDSGDASPVYFPVTPLPRVDADGLPRNRGSVVNIGAYDTHGTHVLRQAAGGAGSSFNIAGPGVPASAFVPFVVTQNWNPNGVGGTYNDHEIGLSYSSSWSLFNQDGVAMPANAAFNIHVPLSNRLPFQDASSAIDDPAAPFTSLPSNLAEDPDLFWLFTLNRMVTSTLGTLNPHPAALLFFTRWHLYNTDAADFPQNASYSLYWQDRSPNAYEHIVGPGNRTGHISRLDHPLLNGTPCAQIQVSATTGGGVFNPHELGVYYNGTRWAIFNQDFAALADNVGVNVLVDPAQAEFCDRIFRDGLE